MLQLYTLWHLNLAYSSIEESRYSDVIQKCYWPLLNLAVVRKIPIGIELPAWTLNKILELDPLWVEGLKEQVNIGKVEIIGSGWTQLIGPLVPAQVVEKNLRLGQSFYHEILGIKPKIALINEQAWTPSMVPIYKKVGFSALVMEWENPSTIHPEWPRPWRYFPQLVKGGHETLPLLWNHSIAFQKMQRLAHGEIPQEEWVEWVVNQDDLTSTRSMCIYGSDVETFNFRPGRYKTEEKLQHDEWDTIGNALEYIATQNTVHVLPSRILDHELKLEPLLLESVQSPVPVKKQPKYNVVRWACGGRDAPGINSICSQIYRGMKLNQDTVNDEDWRSLCELWSSDARTHLTISRWDKWQSRANQLKNKWTLKPVATDSINQEITNKFLVKKNGRFLCITSPQIDLRLNLRRGMAIDQLKFPAVSNEWLLGSLHHGHFDDISWSADFYTWETVLELPGKPKVTDLELCEPIVEELNGVLMIAGDINTSLGKIRKIISITSSPKVSISMELKFLWAQIPPGSLRLGDLILNPDFFDRNSLFIKTHLGGYEPEVHHYPPGLNVEHGKPLSALISSQYCLGVTEGVLEFGDRHVKLVVEQDFTHQISPAMVTCLDIAESYIFRIQFSAREIDDTSGAHSIHLGPEGRTYRFTLFMAD